LGSEFSTLNYQRPSYPPAGLADQNPPCNTLYISNLPIDISENKLKALFSMQNGYKRIYFRIKQNELIYFMEFEDILFMIKALNKLYSHPLQNSVKSRI